MIHVLSHLNKTDVPPNWGKISADRRWVASFQSMPSDMIRAGRQVGWDGGSCHNKGSREGAGPGWSHHSCLLPGTARRNSTGSQTAKQTQNKYPPLSSAVVTYTAD